MDIIKIQYIEKDSRKKLRIITHKNEFHQNINRFNQINLIIDWNE